MVVIWTPPAKNDLAGIWAYYSVRNMRAAVKIVKNIQSILVLVAQNPNIAPAERMLDDRPEGFRSFVVRKRHKVIYHVNDDIIEVVAVWDCRRNPDLLRRMTLRRRAKI